MDLLPNKVTVDARLMELHFGKWENRRWQDIDSPEARLWGNDFATARCPGGESYQDVSKRVLAFWHERLEDASQEHCLVITHAGPIGEHAKCFFRSLFDMTTT